MIVIVFIYCMLSEECINTVEGTYNSLEAANLVVDDFNANRPEGVDVWRAMVEVRENIQYDDYDYIVYTPICHGFEYE